MLAYKTKSTLLPPSTYYQGGGINSLLMSEQPSHWLSSRDGWRPTTFHKLPLLFILLYIALDKGIDLNGIGNIYDIRGESYNRISVNSLTKKVWGLGNALNNKTSLIAYKKKLLHTYYLNTDKQVVKPHWVHANLNKYHIR